MSTGADGTVFHSDFVIDDNKKEMRLIPTDPGSLPSVSSGSSSGEGAGGTSPERESVNRWRALPNKSHI